MGFETGERLTALLARAHLAGMLATEHDYDESEDRIVVRRSQDVEPHLNYSKELQWADDRRGYNTDRTRKHVAHIPNIVVEQWLREGVNVLKEEDWPAARKRLNDPAYWFLRTSPGRI